MKISIMLDDLTVDEASRITDGLAAAGLIPRKPDPLDVSDRPLEEAARLWGGRAEEAAKEPEVKPVGHVTGPLRDKTPEETRAEEDEFIAACDAKWKQTSTLNVEGATLKANDEAVLKETGEVVVLERLYRGKAIVAMEDGSRRLVQSGELGAAAADDDDAPDEPVAAAGEAISEVALRELARELVIKLGPDVVEPIMRSFGSTKISGIKPQDRPALAQAFRAKLQ
jgi:hypothetical protein